MTQVIRTVLEVDASKAVAGFGQGERAVQGYERAVTRAGSSTGATGFDKLTGSIRDNRSAWDQTANSALVGGAALAGGLGLATKAAIDWESAWAGVTKTTDGTPEQMAELEEGLRGLAKTLPATHEELAAVAEAAGQLGVAREDILGFTETAVALGESTNLSAETAAESLAKFSNIMGTASREGVLGYEKMGSALVALGNDGASTEADIMAMSLRLAGAGKQIGATEADILAMANALSSVGIEAELGGGAMSRAMLKMNTAVISGGDELEKFAEISGMSASEFATAWREDPIAATNAFVTGLGRIGDSGGDASAALDGVGLAGTQNAQVLLRAAGASDLMTESLALGAKAWDENAALAEEAGKRYATTESQLKVARNQIKDAAIDIGATLAPVAVKGAETVSGIANAFSSLPGPAKSAITGVAGVTSGVLLLGGATVKAVGWTQDMGKRLDEIGMMTPRVEKGLKGAAAGAKLLGQGLAITAAVGTVGSLLQDQGSTTGVQQLTKDLLEADDAVAAFNASMSANSADLGMIQGDVSSFGDAVKVAFDPGWMDSFTGGADSLFKTVTLGAGDMQTSVDESDKAFASLDATLSGLVASGRTDLAEEMFGQFAAKAAEAGVSTEEFMTRVPGYGESLAALGNQAKLAGDGATQMGGDVEGLGGDMAEAEKAVDELSDAIRDLGDVLLAQEASQDGYEASLDAVTDSIKENGRTLDENTEKGRANRAALRDLVDSTQDWAAAELDATGNVKNTQKILDEGRAAWIRHRDALGANKRETRELADQLFKIDDLEPKANVDIDTVEATHNADGFLAKMKDIDGQVSEATVEEKGATEAKGRVVGLRDAIFGVKGTDVEVTESGATSAKGRVMGLDDEIINLDGKTVTVKEEGANPSTSRLGVMKQAIAVIDGKTVEVTEIGSTAAGNRVVSFKGKIYEVPPTRTTTFTADTLGATMSINALQSLINNMSGRSINVDTTHRTFYETHGVPMGTQRSRWAGGIDGAQPMAEGGFATGYRKQLAGGALKPGIYPTSDAGIWMAEDKRSKWESYIPERPDLRGRAEAILEETASRFGKRVIPMAEGDLRPVGSLMPQPRHFATPAPRVTVQAPAAVSSGATVSDIAPAAVEAIVGAVMSRFRSANPGDVYLLAERGRADRKGRG